jgi:hypothetical protein
MAAAVNMPIFCIVTRCSLIDWASILKKLAVSVIRLGDVGSRFIEIIGDDL